MKPSGNRLVIALTFALISHLLVIWPVSKPPELIPLPSEAYSIDIELAPLTTNNTSLETSKTPDQSSINSKQQQATQALEQPKTAQPKESSQSTLSGRQDTNETQQTDSATTAIQTPLVQEEAKVTHAPTQDTFATHANAPETRQVKKTQGTNAPEVKVEVITQEEQTPQPEIAVISSQPKKQSENADSAAEVTIDTAVVSQPLTAAEQYEATIYAWILNRPDSKIFSASSNQTLQPVIIKTTWWRNGTVIFTKIIQSSGDPSVDKAFQRTILTASPLPAVPDDVPGSEYTLNITQGFID